MCWWFRISQTHKHGWKHSAESSWRHQDQRQKKNLSQTISTFTWKHLYYAHHQTALYVLCEVYWNRHQSKTLRISTASRKKGQLGMKEGCSKEGWGIETLSALVCLVLTHHTDEAITDGDNAEEWKCTHTHTNALLCNDLTVTKDVNWTVAGVLQNGTTKNDCRTSIIVCWGTNSPLPSDKTAFFKIDEELTQTEHVQCLVVAVYQTYCRFIVGEWVRLKVEMEDDV